MSVANVGNILRSGTILWLRAVAIDSMVARHGIERENCHVRDSSSEVSLDEDNGYVGVLECALQSTIGEGVSVEGNIGTPGLEDREDTNDHRDGTLN